MKHKSQVFSAILFSLLMVLSGCTAMDSGTEKESESVIDTIVPAELYEGDDPGDCSDGADNDRDGLFDCDDSNCFGSSECSVENESGVKIENNILKEDLSNSDFLSNRATMFSEEVELFVNSETFANMKQKIVDEAENVSKNVTIELHFGNETKWKNMAMNDTAGYAATGNRIGEQEASEIFNSRAAYCYQPHQNQNDENKVVKIFFFDNTFLNGLGDKQGQANYGDINNWSDTFSEIIIHEFVHAIDQALEKLGKDPDDLKFGGHDHEDELHAEIESKLKEYIEEIGNGREWASLPDSSEWSVVSLTEEMILDGDLDAAECGILLFAAGWDGPSQSNEYALRAAVLTTEAPSVPVWIATFENANSEQLLPSLYDWRNGALDATGMIYVIDDDEVLLIEHVSGNADLGSICLPSQRDSILRLFETINPPPIPFAWSIPVLTSDIITDTRSKYDNGDPICEVITLSPYHTDPIEGWIEEWHDDQAAAIESVGETDVNFWFINMTESVGDTTNLSEGMIQLSEWTGIDTSDWHHFSSGYLVLDNVHDTGIFVSSDLQSIFDSSPCDSDSRIDLYHFFYEMGYYPDLSDVININATNSSLTEYELVEMSENDGWYGIYEDMELTCHSDNVNENFQFTNQSWYIPWLQQTIVEDTLNLSSYGAQPSDEITCKWDVFDTIYNTTFTEELQVTISKRNPLLHSMDILPGDAGVADSIYCDVSVMNPEMISHTVLYIWVVDNDGDNKTEYADGDWWSNYSTSSTFNPDNPEPGNGFSSIQVERGQMIRCVAEVYTPENAQLMLDDGFSQEVFNHNLGLVFADFWIQNSAPTLTSAALSPTSGDAIMQYTCSVSGMHDADGDDIDITYSWYANGMAIFEATTSIIIPYDYGLDSGDTIYCTATASDGDKTSSAVTSNSVILD